MSRAAKTSHPARRRTAKLPKADRVAGVLRYPDSATAAEKPLPRKGPESFPSWTTPVRPRSPALLKELRSRGLPSRSVMCPVGEPDPRVALQVAPLVVVDEARGRDRRPRRARSQRVPFALAEWPVDRLELVVLVLAHRAVLTVRVPSTDMPRSTPRHQDVDRGAAGRGRRSFAAFDRGGRSRPPRQPRSGRSARPSPARRAPRSRTAARGGSRSW